MESASDRPTNGLLVVFDTNFGERMLEGKDDRPVWVVESEANTPVVKALWVARHEEGSPSNVTLFATSGGGCETEFLDKLEAIELHSGQYSNADPYGCLEAVGVPLTAAIKRALNALGLTVFRETGEGFIACS